MIKRLLPLLAVVAAAGCGNDGKQPLAPMSGTITYKGKPVVGASISFIPAANLRPATGVTDANGRYVMETYEPRDGAAVGSGKLAVSLRGQSKKIKPGMGEAVIEELRDMGDPLIPVRYFDPEKSGLRFEVKKGEDNKFDIPLTD